MDRNLFSPGICSDHRFESIRRPLRGHQAVKPSESLLCKRSFKVKSTVQEKLKLMAWSFLRGLEASSFEVSSFEVLMERCKKENCFLLGPQTVSFNPHSPGASRPGASPDRGFSILFLILFSNGLWDAFFSPLDTSRTILEPNMTPTWTKFGTMLDHFSDMFGLLFWHPNIRSFLRRCLIDVRPPASSKTPPLLVLLRIFAFAS